jgi:glucose-1-phosphate thymidylyltransferase
MQGIILAGGSGTRLWPNTKSINKHLLSIFDKPMIYYPLSTLMLAGVRQFVIVVNQEDLRIYQDLFADFRLFGVKIDFVIQKKPEGIPQGLQLGLEVLGEGPYALILGDNIFYGSNLGMSLRNTNFLGGARVFLYHVANPQDYGVIELDAKTKVLSIEEKPESPKSNLAITGLYFFDETIHTHLQNLKKSLRGEYEIVDVLHRYHINNNLSTQVLPRGTSWLDTGTNSSILEASALVRTIEERQGLKIACPEEIAFRNGWVSKSELLAILQNYPKGGYRDYLENFLALEGN